MSSYVNDTLGQVWVYSSILDPTLHFRKFMSIEKGLIAPDFGGVH